MASRSRAPTAGSFLSDESRPARALSQARYSSGLHPFLRANEAFMPLHQVADQSSAYTPSALALRVAVFCTISTDCRAPWQRNVPAFMIA